MYVPAPTKTQLANLVEEAKTLAKHDDNDQNILVAVSEVAKLGYDEVATVRAFARLVFPDVEAEMPTKNEIHNFHADIELYRLAADLEELKHEAYLDQWEHIYELRPEPLDEEETEALNNWRERVRVRNTRIAELKSQITRLALGQLWFWQNFCQADSLTQIIERAERRAAEGRPLTSWPPTD